jgi:hypothetical protein
MKPLFLGSLGLCCTLLPVQAGVKVQVNFGTPYCAPARPVYHCPPVVHCPPPVYRHCPPVVYSYPIGYTRSVYSSSCGPTVSSYQSVVYYETAPRVVVIRKPDSIIVEEPRSQPSYRPQTEPASKQQKGQEWAQDLRREIVEWKDFVSYLKDHLTKASVEDYNEFRKGFIQAYGSNAEIAFDKAFQEARGDRTVRDPLL